jgi:hypothetical protein
MRLTTSAHAWHRTTRHRKARIEQLASAMDEVSDEREEKRTFGDGCELLDVGFLLHHDVLQHLHELAL